MQRLITWQQWSLLVSLTLLLPGLDARADPPVNSGQGTRIHGTVELLEQVNLSLNEANHPSSSPFTQVWIDQGELRGELEGVLLRGEDLVQVSFPVMVDGELTKLWITSARLHTNVYTEAESSTVWEYQVSWERNDERGSLCPGNAPALALPGLWRSGLYVPVDDDRSFFFACLPYRVETELGFEGGGVAAKCVDWGYSPWSHPNREDPAKYHASCVAMATADVCGEGKPNTVEGTPITIFNDGNVQLQPGTGEHEKEDYVAGGPFGTYSASFEAAWTAVPEVDGMDDGWRARAVCLTKKRWSTLPLGGTCPLDLEDPRTGRGRYCDTIPAKELESTMGSVLFSYSVYADVGLYRFKHTDPAKNQFLTTTAISIDPSKNFPESYKPADIPDAADYKLDTNPFEGTVLSPSVPYWFPGRQRAKKLLRVWDGRNYATVVEGEPSEQALAMKGYSPICSDPDPSICPRDPVQGYAYETAADAPHLPQELNLWQRNPDEYVTTTGDASGGYTNIFPLGFTARLQ